MKNRKMILEVLQKVHNRKEQLKDLIEKTSDRELEDILDNTFYEFGTNILVNFTFMEMIVAREDPNEDSDSSNLRKMSNEELEEYFNKNWDLLSIP